MGNAQALHLPRRLARVGWPSLTIWVLASVCTGVLHWYSISIERAKMARRAPYNPHLTHTGYVRACVDWAHRSNFLIFPSSKVTCSLSEHWCRRHLNTSQWWRHTRLITSTPTPASDSCVSVCLDRCRAPSRTARPCRLNSLTMMISLIWLLLR